MKKITLVMIALLLIVSVLASCDSSFAPYEFTAKGLTITLDTSFQSVSSQYTACYQSAKATVYTLKESFDETLTAETSLADYAGMVLESNSIEAEIKEEKNFVSFVFETELVEVTHTFFVCLYKTADAFWMVQFVVPSDSYENQKSDIQAFAESVVFADEINGEE